MQTRKLFLLSLVGLLLFVAGCGGGGGGGGGGGTSGGGGATTIDPATAATVTGKVKFDGTAPKNDPIAMDAEPTCQEQYPNGATRETVLVNDNGTLQNVFVYVKKGLENYKFSPPAEGVVLDQKGCRYHPHVFGIMAGQELIIRNSDGILHNIHPQPAVNKAFNLGQPVKMDSKKKFDQVEVMIPIKCDVHAWMSGYVGVLNHPYFAVTGTDGS
ncbi:MAG: hypothetical protein HY260_19340, partial [Chloroflexi bacterium]|nr:hypothetical protein [Chloroflexota bacterium]